MTLLDWVQIPKLMVGTSLLSSTGVSGQGSRSERYPVVWVRFSVWVGGFGLGGSRGEVWSDEE